MSNIYINFLKSYTCAVMTTERRNGLNITFDNERERERERERGRGGGNGLNITF